MQHRPPLALDGWPVLHCLTVDRTWQERLAAAEQLTLEMNWVPLAYLGMSPEERRRRRELVVRLESALLQMSSSHIELESIEPLSGYVN
jgi:hypothetical protein